MPTPLSRRSLLVSLAGMTLAGCRAATPGRGMPSRVSNSTAAIELGVVGTFPPAVVAAFERAHPKIRIQTGSAATPCRITHITGAGGGTGSHFADLTSALRRLNFNASVLFPGAMAPWTRGGRTFAVPVSAVPWGVAWRRDAFSAAHIPQPADDWTYDDFRNACAALQALAGAGRLKGLRAALGPIAAGAFGRGKTADFQSALSLGAGEGLWQAFVWGFGASFAQGGQFVLTSAATVAALQKLVDLAQAYSVSAKLVAAVPTLANATEWFAAIQDLFAMQFALYDYAPLPAQWAWARLPRFPVEPVIPTISTAVAVSASKHAAPPPAPEAPVTLAAAQFGVWLDSSAALAVTASAGMAPAVAAAGVQTRFWTGPGAGSAGVLGDWRNFRGVYDGFPAVTPPENIVGFSVPAALSQAIAGTSSLSDALARAERYMNKSLVQ